MSFREKYEQMIQTPEGKRIFQQEKLMLNATELIAEIMEEKKVRKADLARLMERTPGFLTKLLGGNANMTLRTFADVLTALGYEADIVSKPIGSEELRDSFKLIGYGQLGKGQFRSTQVGLSDASSCEAKNRNNRMCA